MEEELFKVIRTKEVTLWIGSGFSKYAGYISTDDLCVKLLALLSSEQIQGLTGRDLPTVSQAVEDMIPLGRDHVIEVLNEEFITKKPTSIEHHKQLARIPHFRTIITTNYDRLIELGFGLKAQVIITDKDLHHKDVSKVQILKVHGDTSNPKSIIITKQDYVKFFSTPERNIWSVVAADIATKTQLFIGYDLNDVNVNSVFEKVLSNLEYINKTGYLVAPSLDPYKIARLEKRNIKYINSTGEKFIAKLYQNIADNIIEDQNQNLVDLEVFRKFLEYNNLAPTLVVKSQRYYLKNIEGINGPINGKLKFTLNAPNGFIKQFSDFVFGRKVGEFTIPMEHLINVVIKAGDISITKGDAFSFIFKSIPSREGNFDIKFKSIDNEFLDTPYKIFATPLIFKIVVGLKSGELFLEKTNQNETSDMHFDFKAVHKDLINKTSHEIDYYSFIKQLFNGDEFKIVVEGKVFNYSIPRNEEMVKNADLYLSYFRKLQIIENHYNIRFEKYPFNEINGETEDMVDTILEVIGNTQKERILEGTLKATLDNSWNKSKIEQLAKLHENPQGISIEQLTQTEYFFHGQTINLGYLKMQFPKLRLVNKNDLINKSTIRAEFISEEGKYYISYLSKLTYM